MNKYREKTKTIEAIQFDPERFPWPKGVQSTLVSGRYTVETAEGMVWIAPGDWMVKGALGAMRVCPHQVFTELYEPVDELDAPTSEKIYKNVMTRIQEDVRRSGGAL